LSAVSFLKWDLVEPSDGRIQGFQIIMKVVEDVIANSSPLAFIQDAEEVCPQKTAVSGLFSTKSAPGLDSALVIYYYSTVEQ